jgi:excisionase family DNA binding protein
MSALKGLLDKPDTVIPTQRDTELATESSRILSSLDGTGEFRVHLDGGEQLTLPSAVRTLLIHLLTEMSRGNAVTVIPVHAELTTQEAADFLNVSRPYLVGLLEKGKIKFRSVGTHRRVKFEDLKAFKDKTDREREEAMAELAKQAQELGLGY